MSLRRAGSVRSTSSSRLRVERLEDRLAPVVLPPGFTESVFASGLTTPTAMALAPDGRVFVAEKGGDLRVVQNGLVLPTPFVSLDVNTFSERGLIGVTLDPNFAANQFVYVYYTTDEATPVNRVSRFTAAGNVAAGGETVLLDGIASTNGNHNGGALHFGADGMLYIATGEAGVPSNAQTLVNLSGKLLRINPYGATPGARIPPDNPFVRLQGARGEIWAYGLRNPFTFAVQPGTGRIFINDVGGALFEEVNEGFRIANYGWPQTEGNQPPGVTGVTYPIYAYAHGTGPFQGNTIAGGVFYNPAVNSFPAEFVGDYFFGEFSNGRIFLRDNSTGAVTTFADQNDTRAVVDLDLGPAGQLLYLDIGGGTIFQITFAGPPGGPLSLTAAGTGPGAAAQAAALDIDGSTRFAVPAYEGYFGGVRVATGDVTGDQIEDVVTATGPGAPPHVKVFDGATGGLVASFFAFDPAFLGGLFVAAGDVTGDGLADIIVGTATGSSHVKAFDALGGAEVRSFFAYPGFAGGVTVAAGDADGDTRADIITGTAFGSSHVKAFSGLTGAEVRSFLAFGPGYLGGVSVGFAAGGIVAGAALGASHVKAFDAAGAERSSFFAFAPAFAGGVRVAGDATRVVVGAGPGAGPHLKVFDALSAAELVSRFVFDPLTPGGIFVG